MHAARPVLLLTLLTSPFATAYAVDYENPDAIPLVVQYEGTVFETSGAPPGYAVGDRLTGRLLIDPRIEYFESGNANQATYRALSPYFVTGFWPIERDGNDYVFMANELADGTAPIDVFGVRDWSIPEETFPVGPPKTFSITATLRGLLSNVSLEQSFEVSSADVDEADESLLGRINFGDALSSFLQFTVDRLSVRPGRCHAP
jgi:hypothetical protein